MQIMLGDATGDALAMLDIRDRRLEAAQLAEAANANQVGNVWLAVANYVAAPAKGGTRVVRSGQGSALKPEHLAVGALAAVAAYLALG
jgi:hypothetical protein